MKNPSQFTSCEELRAYLAGEGIALPLSERPEQSLGKPVALGARTLRNSIAIQPMEGCDACRTGEPDELTHRRYRRFAESGAGLIWFEATAVLPEARANPHQLYITKENVHFFAELVEEIRAISMKKFGWSPVILMQATHSGRFSKPNGAAEPIIAYENPYLNKNVHAEKQTVISDDELKRLEEKMGEAAALAKRAGFDGMDVKSCHCYLFSEILSAYTRPGEYGGCFENRTRLIRNCLAAARANTAGDFILGTRLNVYDGFPYPYGFGVREGGSIAPELSEGKRLIRALHEQVGIAIADITVGTPYVNPHMNRPTLRPSDGSDENPYAGVARILDCAHEIKRACSAAVRIVGSGLSFPGVFAGNIAAGALEEGYFDIAGFGRMAFANPEFPQQLLHGGLDAGKICLACGKCTELMRAGSRAGCAIRDRVYTELYRRDVLQAGKKGAV